LVSACGCVPSVKKPAGPSVPYLIVPGGVVGPEHPDTLTARANLAASYQQAGRTGEAIAIGERGRS
jgi:hypothetical protein